MANLQTEYPRPQFQRKDWLNLNGEWNFSFDDQELGLQEKWYQNFPAGQTIKVPFAYQTENSGIGDPSFHEVVWYNRTFSVPEDWQNKRIQLNFGAVDYRAWIYVNGEKATYHQGGNVPFSADITDLLVAGENSLTVRVEDPSEDTTIPRGKQYWHEESASIFYTRTTGIWQTVWLEPVAETSIKSLRWTPEIDRGDIEFETELAGKISGNTKLRITVSFQGEPVLSEEVTVFQPHIKRSINIRGRFPDRSNIHGPGWYWSPEHPNLFDARVELIADEKAVDTITSYFGMRKVSIENGTFMLNNKPYYQKLVLDQGYFPGGLLTAESDDALKQDIVLAKEMGFNGARKHQKVEDPRFLYWADQLGYLVWGEMANCAEYSEEAVERISAEWIEAVKRDYSHPSLVVWVPLNESWGISRVAREKQQQHHSLAMYYLTKSLDPTRPVCSNEGWEHTVSDLCGIHNYQSPEKMAEAYRTVESAVAATPADRPIYAEGFGYRGEPILITEYGGIAYDTKEIDQKNGWGYSAVQGGEELIEAYRQNTKALLDSSVVQGFCYTQLTDVEQEINGLLTYHRKPKCDLSEIKKINDGK
ncbi:beta-galactosidase/beta-glucuronidase [Planomicrobium stackebrandtii]|uniref:Beta-galactosidase/beta-glucuronidase n=1 Tax=Planomicrobium stackebrandtii TaxID=253160 RepID=A0ABU0GV05_9BACL|nr:sugar-binding domain-containing protein [Planomicrobium stackebrandtii]MDQ0428616.1 beta-galactosidase/beta-glucuronidase [Planomicrobium stackebrandtii]